MSKVIKTEEQREHERLRLGQAKINLETAGKLDPVVGEAIEAQMMVIKHGRAPSSLFDTGTVPKRVRDAATDAYVWLHHPTASAPHLEWKQP